MSVPNGYVLWGKPVVAQNVTHTMSTQPWCIHLIFAASKPTPASFDIA